MAQVTGWRARLILGLVGGFVVLTVATGQYTRYVRPGMQPFLLLTGAIVVVLAGHGALREWRRHDLAVMTAPSDQDVHDGHDDDHHGQPGTAWLMLAPVVCFALLAPPALGSYSASRATDAAAVGAPSTPSGQPAWRPLPSGDVVPLRMGEFITRARWDDSGTLSGRTVRLTGFVTPGLSGVPSTERGEARWDVARMAIMCCAADAAVYRVRLDLATGATGVVLPDVDTWVEVQGRWLPGPGDSPVNSEPPRLQVTSVRRIEPPANPYEKQ